MLSVNPYFVNLELKIGGISELMLFKRSLAQLPIRVLTQPTAATAQVLLEISGLTHRKQCHFPN